ncbi:MAG TPA: nucleotidyltransferase family protein [Ignavibacteriales bacterium]|nr:nucleotidyltransferase family protein [Ignavibacteriales bacterium]HEX3074374.1 nucleotidyltransferase family protein [Ignavibacteriales bacterium]
MRKPLNHIINTLQKELPFIKSKYAVVSLELFGSYVRGEEQDGSDVDILASFSSAPTLIQFMQLENYLSAALGLTVDLVMKDSLKKNMREQIIREAKII